MDGLDVAVDKIDAFSVFSSNGLVVSNNEDHTVSVDVSITTDEYGGVVKVLESVSVEDGDIVDKIDGLELKKDGSDTVLINESVCDEYD